MIVRKAYEDLTFTDDFMFFQVMQNKELCIELIETLINIKIKDIKAFDQEKIMKMYLEAKSVRLDLYLEGEDQLFNVEMQLPTKDNLAKRAQHYLAMMAVNKLKKGEDYEKRPESYVIFLCTFDYFEKCLPQYTFLYQCQEDPSVYLGDETCIVFFNATAYEKAKSDQLKDLLRYAAKQVPSQGLTEKIQEEIIKLKKREEGRSSYMTILAKYEVEMRHVREEGIEEGIEIGKEEGIEIGVEIGKEEGIEIGKEEGIEIGERKKALKTAKRLLGTMEPEQIATLLDLTLEQVHAVKEEENGTVS